jgi:hypothetical protein
MQQPVKPDSSSQKKVMLTIGLVLGGLAVIAVVCWVIASKKPPVSAGNSSDVSAIAANTSPIESSLPDKFDQITALLLNPNVETDDPSFSMNAVSKKNSIGFPQLKLLVDQGGYTNPQLVARVDTLQQSVQTLELKKVVEAHKKWIDDLFKFTQKLTTNFSVGSVDTLAYGWNDLQKLTRNSINVLDEIRLKLFMIFDQLNTTGRTAANTLPIEAMTNKTLSLYSNAGIVKDTYLQPLVDANIQVILLMLMPDNPNMYTINKILYAKPSIEKLQKRLQTLSDRLATILGKIND